MLVSDTLMTEMKENIYNNIYHPYLKEQLKAPLIDDDKLYLLLSILHLENIPVSEYEKYVLPVILIQIALDTHEHVKNDSEEKPLKQQQLTVLAGDYYSGLYYHSLANVPNINLIQMLSTSIKAINENKIRVYKKELHTFQDFMNSMQMIETNLYQTIAHFFQNRICELLSSDWLFINQIKKHRKQYTQYILDNQLVQQKRQVEIEQLIDLHIQKMQSKLFYQLKDPFVRKTFLNKLSIQFDNRNSSVVR